MRVCRLCAGPMPEIVRDDALYCCTSCKLKAQRKRNKERARQTTEKVPRVFEPVAPFGNVEQLAFSFVAPETSTVVPPESEAGPVPPDAQTAAKPKPRSWLGGLVERLKGGTNAQQTGSRDTDPSPRRQRSKATEFDIV